MRRVSRLVPTVMALALLAGCGGGQTGDLSGENGNQHGNNTGSGTDGCDDQLSEIALDDSSALGFDPQAVLAFAAKSFQADLAWQALDTVEYSPSASQSQITLTLSSRNQAWLVHSVPAKSSNEPGGTLGIGVVCPPDRLRVAVHAALDSADGALAESFDTTLDASSSYVATLSRAIVPGQVAGSFAITKVTPPAAGGPATGAVQNLQLDAVLTPGGMTGTLHGQLTTMNSQVASAATVTFARFPGDTRCVTPGTVTAGVPVSADNLALGLSGTDALSEVNDFGSVPIAWSDRTSSDLTLELSGLGDGCVQVGGIQGFYDPGTPAATVVYPVSLKATTADGRLQGQYTASLVTWPNADGAGFSELLQVQETFPANTPAATGFDPVSAPSGTQRLRVHLSALFERGIASGKLGLDALKDPPCVTNPEPPSGNSSPGCSGTEVTPLFDAAWPQ